MAKKTQSYSQVQATDELEQLGRRGTSAPEFVYDLLRIFSGYGDGQVRRTKDGPGNLAKDTRLGFYGGISACWFKPFRPYSDFDGCYLCKITKNF